MGLDRILHYQEVATAEAALDQIQTLLQTFPISIIVIGNQTTSKQWREQLATLPDPPRVMLVDERYSTLEARDRYWQIYPPEGIGRLIPKAFRKIPRPIDDIVAILLIERYLNRLTGG